MSDVNTTPNQQHPLIGLLSDISMNDWLSPHNFTAYSSMADALRLDGKSTQVKGALCMGLENPIQTCDELFVDQLRVIDGLVSSWALGVMQPMIDTLNTHSSVGDLELNFDGDLQTAILNFDGVNDFIDGVSLDDVDTIKKILNDWAYSCFFIKNIETFRSALDAHAKTATNTTDAEITGAYDVLFEIMTGDHIIHNEVRVPAAESEDEAIQFALEAEFGGDEDSIAEQMALIKSGETSSVKNHDETLSYKPVMVISLQEVAVEVVIDGVATNKTVLVPREALNPFNSTRYYK